MDINIRPTELKDVDALCEIYTQPKAHRETLQLPLPSPQMWHKRLSNIPEHVYTYVAEVDGKVVGNIGFEHMQRPRLKHVGRFGLGIHDDYHGMGVGSKLLETVIHLADKWLNLRRIELDVNCDNEAALALYRKFGFKVEGEAVDGAFREGEFVNVLHMARINPNHKN
ncbi:GNAT family N-acetyltransferase [Vibrio penaeicida]|uniref:GNAT family N-acetyltransferase n=1 Tax=Vibrio penaeicida TaxID=104609 RepID=UPI000CE9EAC2|nr:GNAT family N-acetyltransferase [Vibrio penaeicida]